MTPPAAHVRSYRISPVRRSVLWWIFGPLVLAGLGICLFADADKKGAGVIFILLTAPWLAWWHWYTGRLRLEVSAEGVTHRHGKLVMQAKWDQIERVRLDRAREGLVVCEAIEGRAVERLASVRGIWISGVPLYDNEQQRLMGEHRWIPLDPFAYLLRNGRLQADLDEFAPELGKAVRGELEEQALIKRLPKPPASPQQQMATFGFFALMAGLIGLGVWMAMSPDSPVAQAVDRVMSGLVAICLLAGAVLSVWSCRNAFKSRSAKLCILFALLAVVQFLLGIAVAVEVAGLSEKKDAGAATQPSVSTPAR